MLGIQTHKRLKIAKSLETFNQPDLCLKLLQYKCLMRVYITLVKLHRISSNIADVRCPNEKGTLIQCLREYHEILWRMVKNKIIPLKSKSVYLEFIPRTWLELQSKQKWVIIDFSMQENLMLIRQTLQIKNKLLLKLKWIT